MHDWLAGAIRPLVLLHVLAAFAFALLHGPSAYAMWQLRRERAPARVGALLDLSRAASAPSAAALAILGATGLLLAGAEHLWARPWIWGSAIALLALSGAMSALAARPFNEARFAAGLRWFDGRRLREATGALDADALERALARIRGRAAPTLALGAAGLALLVWLMVARPG